MSRPANTPSTPNGSEEIRVPPHNDEAERSCLGACFITGYAWALVLTKLKRNDFYRESHRHLYDSLSRLYAAQVVPDVITVSDDLTVHGLLEMVGGPNYIARLSSEVPSAANVEYYINIVSEKATLRRAAYTAYKIGDSVYDDGVTSGEVAAHLASLMDGLRPESSRATTANSERAAAEFWDLLEGELSGGGGGASTGVEAFDELLRGGLKPGRAYYLGALAKMGKTTVAAHLASRMFWREEWAVDYVSVEQNPADMVGKFLAWETGIDRRALGVDVKRLMERVEVRARTEQVELTADNAGELLQSWFPLESDALRNMRATLKRASDKLASSKRVWFTHESAPDAREIALMARARQMELAARGHDPQKYMLVCDYLQSFECGAYTTDERVRIANASRTLSGVAHDLNCVVLVLFQFRKEADDGFLKYGRMPRFSDAAGTGQIARDCNNMLIWHRPGRDSERVEERSFGVLRHELSRDGGDGEEVELHADMIRNYLTSWPGASLRHLINRGDDDKNNNGRR